jgi:peroxiredoxin
MGLLKSAFISAYLVWLVLAVTYALLQMLRGVEPLLSWLGMALAALGPLSFFAWVFASKPSRTERHPVEHSALSGLGLAICMALAWRHGTAAGWAHAWAAVSLVGWMVYLRWYSPLPKPDAESLESGALLPDFQLQSLSGETVNSALFRGQPHILVFIRGNWCPFCTAQVREIAAACRELAAAGARVAVISPQPLTRQEELARRFEAPMEFLQDPGNRAASQLGIAARWGTPLGLQALGYGSDTVLPTVIITDADGRVMQLDSTDNYRIRPEPQEFLRVLQSPAQPAPTP